MPSQRKSSSPSVLLLGKWLLLLNGIGGSRNAAQRLPFFFLSSPFKSIVGEQNIGFLCSFSCTDKKKLWHQKDLIQLKDILLLHYTKNKPWCTNSTSALEDEGFFVEETIFLFFPIEDASNRVFKKKQTLLLADPETWTHWKYHK